MATILIIDDEENVREVVSLMAERLGYHTIMASGGAEAIELLRNPKTEVDLVLLDLTMPGMNGEQTLAEICSLRPGLKVMFISGQDENPPPPSHAGASLAGFVRKPFNITGLRDKLAEVLKKSQPSA
ncbi:MAG: response regulator [Verrucomicrobiae bacterium]|nr:response regulator [Verrucomicrobiae bacterium]